VRRDRYGHFSPEPLPFAFELQPEPVDAPNRMRPLFQEHRPFQLPEISYMKSTALIITASITLFAGANAFAEEVPNFKKADADGSGFVEEGEYGAAKAAGVEKPYKELDKNNDGKLDQNEYSVILDEDCE
jgi:hypothetical protein